MKNEETDVKMSINNSEQGFRSACIGCPDAQTLGNGGRNAVGSDGCQNMFCVNTGAIENNREGGERGS